MLPDRETCFGAENAVQLVLGAVGSPTDASQRQPGGVENAEDQPVPFQAIRAFVTTVIELHAEQGLQRRGVAEEEVEVLALDPVAGAVSLTMV